VPETSAQDPGSEQQSAAQGVRDLIERTFLVGVGAAALTKERVQGLVEEFVRRGQLTGDEGREMVERLVARSKTEAQSVLKKADSSLHGAYRDMGLAARRDLEDLDFRLRQLEHRIRMLEDTTDANSPPVASADSDS
jgi:polyhydroxyalkanoate synthesis regulator phasin